MFQILIHLPAAGVLVPKLNPEAVTGVACGAPPPKEKAGAVVLFVAPPPKENVGAGAVALAVVAGAPKENPETELPPVGLVVPNENPDIIVEECTHELMMSSHTGTLFFNASCRSCKYRNVSCLVTRISQ